MYRSLTLRRSNNVLARTKYRFRTGYIYTKSFAPIYAIRRGLRLSDVNAYLYHFANFTNTG
jgi:hypothetical protein